MSGQREVAIVGSNNTRVKVTGQEELLVKINAVDLAATGLAKESTLSTINTNIASVNTSLNNIESALTGNFEVGAILGSGLTFPYTVTDNVYMGITLIIPSGQTVDLEGATLPAGTYNFSGEGNKKAKSFVLSNPSTTPSGIILLTVK